MVIEVLNGFESLLCRLCCCLCWCCWYFETDMSLWVLFFNVWLWCGDNVCSVEELWWISHILIFLLFFFCDDFHNFHVYVCVWQLFYSFIFFMLEVSSVITYWCYCNCCIRQTFYDDNCCGCSTIHWHDVNNNIVT